MSSILIENGTVLTLNETDDILVPGYVNIEDGLIAAVGTGTAGNEIRSRAEQIIDASRMAVLPGMINAHVHSYQSFVRGLGGNLPLLDWLREVAWPVWEHMTSRDIYLASMVSLLENIRGGATAVIDNHVVHPVDGDDAVCQAAEKVGLRYTLARGWADQNYHPTLQETPDRILAEMERLFQTWNGQANGRIRVEFGPLIPWGCSEKTLLRTHELAKAWGTGIQMHTAETRIEIEMSLEATGKRHVEWLADLGILGPQTQLVHCVWLTDQEIETIAETGTVVVHCPVSNMFLGSGIPRIADMVSAGVTVSLGTDGQACNNADEMADLLRITSNMQKVGTLDAQALSPTQVLRMACSGGSQALGQADHLGSLELGKAADLVLIDLANPRTMMLEDVTASLVNLIRQDDVHTVIVDGNILMQDGHITAVDEEALIDEAQAVLHDLLRRTGIETMKVKEV